MKDRVFSIRDWSSFQNWTNLAHRVDTPPEHTRRALKNVGSIVSPGGMIFIKGSGIIDNSRISPPNLAGINLVFINVYDQGQAFTEQEHQDWLEEAGFGDFARTLLPDGRSILTARKMK